MTLSLDDTAWLEAKLIGLALSLDLAPSVLPFHPLPVLLN